MLFSEYTDLAEPKGLGLTVDHFEIAQAVYGAVDPGGRPGHEAAVKWAVKNRAIFEALASLRLAERQVAQQLVETQGESIRSRQRHIEDLERQLARERQAAVEEHEQLEAGQRVLQSNLDCCRERDNRSQDELNRLRRVATDLETVKQAFRILSDGAGQ